MADEWIPPKPEVKLEGSVTYVCGECGLIAERVVFAPLDARGDMTPATRAYHPDHAPQEVTTNGR